MGYDPNQFVMEDGSMVIGGPEETYILGLQASSMALRPSTVAEKATKWRSRTEELPEPRFLVPETESVLEILLDFRLQNKVG